MKKIVHDTTDAFDQRLDILQAAHVPQIEIDCRGRRLRAACARRSRSARPSCRAPIRRTAVFALLEAINDEVALHTPME
jgi:hypothetical protein